MFGLPSLQLSDRATHHFDQVRAAKPVVRGETFIDPAVKLRRDSNNGTEAAPVADTHGVQTNLLPQREHCQLLLVGYFPTIENSPEKERIDQLRHGVEHDLHHARRHRGLPPMRQA